MFRSVAATIQTLTMSPLHSSSDRQPIRQWRRYERLRTRCWQRLTPAEAKALRKRFGLDTGAEHTLENIQRRFDITRERIRLTEQAAHLSRVLDQFLTRVPCLPWDAEAATHFAGIAVDLHRTGSPIGSMDTMIAGHALAVGAVLVTGNERHFARVTGLKVENWTRS